jgi:phosphoglycerate kinase
VAEHLRGLLDRDVRFVEDCVGPSVSAAVAEMKPGELALLENLRFHAGEEKNDPEFALQLAQPARAYVNDAFGAAHRAHASVTGVVAHLPRRAAGRLLVREVEALSRLLTNPEHPFTALLGGAKIEGKLDTLNNLLPRVDCLLLGGGMANTFLVAQGYDLGASLFEPERLELARSLLAEAVARGVEVLLPEDLVVADSLEHPSEICTVPVDQVPQGYRALDIGPATRERYARQLQTARTLFWNGPVGAFEFPPFDAGTRALAHALADAQGFSVVGGGETVAAVRQAGVADRLGHVSTGGGASLEFLAGRSLPGVTVLEKP